MIQEPPTTNTDVPIRIRTVGDVIVEEYLPDYQDPGAGVYQRLKNWVDFLTNDASEDDNATSIFFLNARYTIRASSPSPTFWKQRQIAQDRWMWEYRRLCGTRAGLKFKLKISSRLLERPDTKYLKALKKRLEYTGVDLPDGELVTVHGDRLQPSATQPTRSLQIGTKIGRLTIISDMSGGRYQCRCVCGTVKEIRRQHLVSRRTKSCGCWKREIDARRQRRKEAHLR